MNAFFTEDEFRAIRAGAFQREHPLDKFVRQTFDTIADEITKGKINPRDLFDSPLFPQAYKKETAMKNPTDISEIRRAAAIARWTQPKRETKRLHITIPAELAHLIDEIAKRTGATPSAIVARALDEILRDDAPAPATVPFDLTFDACAVDPATALPTLLRTHVHADGTPDDTRRVSDEDAVPALAGAIRAHRAKILAAILPGLTLAEHAQATLNLDGLTVVIMAARGLRQ